MTLPTRFDTNNPPRQVDPKSMDSTEVAPDLDQVLLQDVSVSDRVLGDPLDGVPSSGHGQDLVDDRLDVLLSGEVEHLEHLLLGTCSEHMNRRESN